MSIFTKKNLIITTALFLLLTTTGLGCKGVSEEEQASVQPVTLNYWTVYNDVKALRQLAQEYQLMRPYVKVNIRQVRYDEFDNLFVNALADDVSPDIVSTHIHWLRKYQSRLNPMPSSVRVSNIYVKGEYVKETVITTENIALPSMVNIKRDYVGAIADDVIIGDKVYGLPLAFDTMALYYNKDLLDKAGVALPPTNWEEFQSAVEKTTRFDTNGNIIQAGTALGTGDNVENMFDILSLLIMQEDVDMTMGTRVAFADEVDKYGYDHLTMKALRFYTDYARPIAKVYTWDKKMENSLDAFTRGKLVFYFGFAYDKARIKARAPQMNLEILPMLQLKPRNEVNIASYWVESVVEKSKNKNLAWDFIRFITREENIKRYTETTGLPNPLRSQLEEQKSDPELSPFVSQALIAKNWYKGKNIEATKEAFSDLINGMLEPIGDKENMEERDSNLLIRSAQIIQQTMR